MVVFCFFDLRVGGGFSFPVQWCFNGGGDGWISMVRLSFGGRHAIHRSGKSSLGSTYHLTYSSQVNRSFTYCRPNGRSKPFVLVL